MDLTQDTSIQLSNLVTYLYRAYDHKVVILIDEYDSPLLHNLVNKDDDVVLEVREYMASFFATIKSLNHYLHFLFITGITKFSKVSIFSGMNNIRDISMMPETHAFLGYNQNELEENFSPYINRWTKNKKCSQAELLALLKQWYNGYRFAEDEVARLYAPFSIHLALETQKFKNYWFESATPSFLVSLLQKKMDETIKILEGPLSIFTQTLSEYDIFEAPVKSILVQTGYLTIKDYDQYADELLLAYPNKEVRDSFSSNLLKVLSNNTINQEKTAPLGKTLRSNDLPHFFKHLHALFARLPYNLYIKKESFFHSTILAAMYGATGLVTESEISASQGRIDMVCETEHFIFVFEFKHGSTPDAALQQIHTQNYAARYAMNGKKIILVGASFSIEDKNVVIKWKSE